MGIGGDRRTSSEEPGNGPGAAAAFRAACRGRWFAAAVAAILVSRVLVWCAALASIAMAEPGDFIRDALGVPFFSADSVHYQAILEEGYTFHGEPGTRTSYRVCFFPGYPLAAWPLAQVMPTEAALLLTNNALGLAGLLLAYVWAHGRLGGRGAFFTTLLLCAYPPALFLSAAYSEGLFLLAVAAGLWAIDRGRFTAGAAAAGLATAVRPTGVVLAPVLVIEAWRRRSVSLPRLAMLVLLCGAGGLAYEAFLTARFDDPSVYFQAQKNWEATSRPRRAAEAPAPAAAPEPPAQAAAADAPERWTLQWAMGRFTSRGAWMKAMTAAIVLVSLGGLASPGPIPRSYFLIPLLIYVLTIVPGEGVRWFSVPRFLLPALPTFAVLAWWLRRRPAVLGAGAAGAMAVQCVFAYWFTRGWFFG